MPIRKSSVVDFPYWESCEEVLVGGPSVCYTCAMVMPFCNWVELVDGAGCGGPP